MAALYVVHFVLTPPKNVAHLAGIYPGLVGNAGGSKLEKMVDTASWFEKVLSVCPSQHPSIRPSHLSFFFLPSVLLPLQEMTVLARMLAYYTDMASHVHDQQKYKPKVH